MTWVKLSDDALDDPRLLALDRGVVLMHLEALAYSNRHNLGGRIPRPALRKLTTEADPEAAATALVSAGLWTAPDEGVWQLVWLLDDQPTEEEVERTRERWRRAQTATRERRTRHLAGDHSTCDPRRCRVLLRARLSDDVSDDVSDESSHPPTPTRLRPDPEEEGRGGGGAASARSRQEGARAPRRGEEATDPEARCWFCAQPAPDGLRLIWDGDRLVHPSADAVADLPPAWQPYATDAGVTCPPDLPGYGPCEWCLGAFPIDEMVDLGDADGASRWACATCHRNMRDRLPAARATA